MANVGSFASGRKLSTGNYEFNDQENGVIEKTAKLAKAWGIVTLVAGVLLLFATIAGAALPMIFSSEMDHPAYALIISLIVVATFGPFTFVSLVTGWYYINSGMSLQRVVESTGDDVGLLMKGLGKMGGAFKIEFISIIFSFVLVVMLLIASTFIDDINFTSGG